MTSSTITTTAAAIMAPSLRSPLALSLTLLGLVALCQGSSTHNYQCYSFDTAGKGAIKPKGDIVVEVGSSYEAYCLFNPEEVQVKDVYFESTGDDGRRIPHTVVNSSAIKVQVEHTEPTKYDLRCLMGEGRFICQRSVFVGYEPQDVKNFSCISKNFLSLNCTWEEPENPVKVTYTLTYVLPGYLDSRQCPKAGKNWCYWGGAQFHTVRQDWVMTFTANNELIKDKNKKPVEFKHEVNIYTTVIPDPAINFEAEVLGPHEVKLEWALPYPMNVFTHGNVTHELKYRMVPFRGMNEDRHWSETWEVSPPEFNPESYTRVISDLQPYIEYEFSIRLHTGSGPVRKEMWSKPVLKRIRTEASRPAIGPLTTLGMFEVEETKLHRDIYVSWQTVDPVYENGPDFAYEVKIYNNGHKDSYLSSLLTANGFAKFSRLDNNIEYRFEIRPRNAEGLPEDSNVKSEVIVPIKAALISTPSYFKVIAYPGINTTTYMVRWRLPEHQHADHNIKTVTLYWCKQTEYENRCQNKIEWEISDEPNNFVKNLTGYDTTSRYMFGISVNSHNSSSGIKWSACIARHGVQQPALQRFYHTYVSSTEVKLKWELDCKAEAAQPNAFNVSYCVVEENGKKCSEPEKYVRVDGESTVEYVVNNLHPYRHYMFSIATISDLGLGKWTPSILVTTKPSMPSGPPLNLEVIGTSQTSISLAWDPPAKSEQNGEIIEYTVTIKNGDNRSFSQRRNVTTFTTTELDPYTYYSFEVIPCTRVDGGKACGSHAANINAKTKIGAPGKIDLFQYNSPWLSWEHDKCNGPSCSYELQYTVNDTTFMYTTSLEQTSVSLEDLNISCPVKQGEIPVSLRAVSTDEEGHRLSGPSWDMKVTCPSKGSYNSDVPIIQSNTHILLVPFPVSNQYNTNLLSVLGILRTVWFPEHMPDAESVRLNSMTHGNSNNENYQQSLLDTNNAETVKDEMSSLQLIAERENERSHSVFGNDISSQRAPHHESTEYHQEQLQMFWRWAPFMRQNIFVWFPIQFLHQDHLNTRVSLMREHFLHSRQSNIPEASISDAEVLDDFQIETNDHKKIALGNIELYSDDNAERNFPTSSNQSEYNTDEAVTTGSNHEILEHPLVELLNSKDVEISLNASSDNFEFKISGQENFFKFLQSINFHINNCNTSERNMISQNDPHDAGVHDRKTNESKMDNQSHDANIDQNHSPTTTVIHNFTNGEIVQEQALMNESSEFMGLSANNTGSSVDDSPKLPVLVNSIENSPHLSLLPATETDYGPHLEGNFSINNDSSVDLGSESFQHVNAAEESHNPYSTESNSPINRSINNISLYSEQAHSDVIYASTMTPIRSDSITLNVNEPGKADMNEHRSRRNVKMTPVTFVQIPQRNQSSLLDFLQGKHRTGRIPQALNDLSLNDMETSQRGVFHQGTALTKIHRKQNTESTEASKSVNKMTMDK